MTDKLPFALYSRCVKAGKRFYYIDAILKEMTIW